MKVMQDHQFKPESKVTEGYASTTPVVDGLLTQTHLKHLSASTLFLLIRALFNFRHGFPVHG
jgi:S-adenosylmethionine:tRNA-ribosyltransferase-isomerase (queuine synthetase)